MKFIYFIEKKRKKKDKTKNRIKKYYSLTFMQREFFRIEFLNSYLKFIHRSLYKI